jgi:glycosyltransferase involved in cell wall biosynthesis
VNNIIPSKISCQKWPIGTSPVVTVFCWVYNQNEYVRQCIESIIMQETTFPVEIIIQDDASNDGTSEIIKEYEILYPTLFKNILFEENQYSQGNSIMNYLFERSSGKYIALAHGDDYWTDSLKLEKQISIMKNNPNCNIVYHNCMTIDNVGNNLQFVYDLNFKKDLTIIDLFRGDYTKTCTLVIRNGIVNDFPDFLDDTLFAMLLLEKGEKAIYIPDVMAVYRIHIGGVWSMKSVSQRYLQSEIIEKYLYDRYKTIYPDLISSRIINFYYSQSIQLVTAKYYLRSIYVLMKYLNKDSSISKRMKNVLRYFKWFIFSFTSKK